MEPSVAASPGPRPTGSGATAAPVAGSTRAPGSAGPAGIGRPGRRPTGGPEPSLAAPSSDAGGGRGPARAGGPLGHPAGRLGHRRRAGRAGRGHRRRRARAGRRWPPATSACTTWPPCSAAARCCSSCWRCWPGCGPPPSRGSRWTRPGWSRRPCPSSRPAGCSCPASTTWPATRTPAATSCTPSPSRAGGSISIDDPLLAAGDLPVQLAGPGARFPAIWISDAAGGVIFPQFYHLWPALLATSYDVGGYGAIVATDAAAGRARRGAGRADRPPDRRAWSRPGPPGCCWRRT